MKCHDDSSPGLDWNPICWYATQGFIAQFVAARRRSFLENFRRLGIQRIFDEATGFWGDRDKGQ
jgi:hypothetical protein